LERERLLMLAVLEDAVDCYQKHAHARDPRAAQLFEEAEEWVESADRSWLFSFENICDTLEINADYVRRGLREWRQHARQLRQTVQVGVTAAPEQAPSLHEATA
jgi:hypothetical protein